MGIPSPRDPPRAAPQGVQTLPQFDPAQQTQWIPGDVLLFASPPPPPHPQNLPAAPPPSLLEPLGAPPGLPAPLHLCTPRSCSWDDGCCGKEGSRREMNHGGHSQRGLSGHCVMLRGFRGPPPSPHTPSPIRVCSGVGTFRPPPPPPLYLTPVPSCRQQPPPASLAAPGRSPLDPAAFLPPAAPHCPPPCPPLPLALNTPGDGGGCSMGPLDRAPEEDGLATDGFTSI